MADSTRTEKRLKFSDPDLTIIVGRDDDQETFKYHSAVMVTYSDYVHEVLSLPRKENKLPVIGFPSIATIDWVKMISSLENPIQAQNAMTVTEAIKFCVFSIINVDFAMVFLFALWFWKTSSSLLIMTMLD